MLPKDIDPSNVSDVLLSANEVAFVPIGTWGRIFEQILKAACVVKLVEMAEGEMEKGN